MSGAPRSQLPRFATPSPQRSQNMRAIRAKDNRTTERRLRAVLKLAGISGWRSHPVDISFSPDLFFREHRLVVFVDGCFWHGCPKCGHMPRRNADYWSAKIRGNQRRDRRARRILNRQGYSVVRIRECALKRNPARCVHRISRYLRATHAAV